MPETQPTTQPTPGDQAIALPPEERRRWLALTITSATGTLLAALQIACAMGG